MNSEMYKQQIIELYKNPENFGKLEGKGIISKKEFNSLCGDEIEIFIKLENKKIKDVKFQGKGCAISIAAASLLTEKVKGKSLEEIKKLNSESIKEMLGIPISSGRIKCATLCLEAIKRIETPKK